MLQENIDILAITFNVIYTYFDSSIEFIFRSVIKFLDVAAKPFFPCTILFKRSISKERDFSS